MAFSKLYELIKTMIFLDISEYIKLSTNVWNYHWYALPFCEKKNKAAFCHRFVSILGENVTLETVGSFSNHAKAKNSTCHFWVTPKVCFIFS